MRSAVTLGTRLVFFAIIACTSTTFAEDKHISRDQLPNPVRQTADEQAKGATIRGYAKEVENGQLEYEVQLTKDGHTKDVSIAPDGSVLEVEEQVQMESLPAEVRSGLETMTKSGKITKVESLTKHGTLVAYEAQVVTGGKRSEIQVGPDGKRLDHEE